jgi:hypothetical protein
MTTVDRAGDQLYRTRAAALLRKDRQRGMAAWEQAAAAREPEAMANRQAGAEARRRVEALRRVSHAMTERHELLAGSAHQADVARGIVVHRLEWMRERLAAGLGDHGIAVVASEHDGADGLGVTIAEQPVLLVVEDRLPSLRAVEVVSSVREFDALLEAGVAAVFSRRIPPADICAHLAGLLRERPDEPLVVA